MPSCLGKANSSEEIMPKFGLCFQMLVISILIILPASSLCFSMCVWSFCPTDSWWKFFFLMKAAFALYSFPSWDWLVGKCCWQNLLKMHSRTSAWGLYWTRQPLWSASVLSYPELRMPRCWKSWKQSLGTKERWAGRRLRGCWRKMEIS